MKEPEKVNEDKRGWIYRILLEDGRECIFIFTKRGFARGGEFHKSKQTDILMSGRLLWRTRRRLRPRYHSWTAKRIPDILRLSGEGKTPREIYELLKIPTDKTIRKVVENAKKLPSDPPFSFIQNPGEQISWAAGEVHLHEALEDSLLIEWLDSLYEKTFDPELRSIVEKKMRGGEETSASS